MAANFLIHPPGPRKQRVFRLHTNIDGWSDEELRRRYRFGQHGINFIGDVIRNDLERATKRNSALSVQNQVMITLRYLASGSFLQVVGDTLGFDKSTVSRTVKRVTEALVARADTFIKWPDATAKSTIKTGFYRMAGFPNVIGCIDGTHVRIQAPSHDENSFVNRKGFHSINVQAVCDHEGKLTNINASWPGSVHDSHIFRTSQIRTYLEEEENGLFENGVLLGDSGYACRPFLLTPYANPQNEPEEKYNQAHARTRSEIERTFGRLKRRFHVLHSEIRMKPDRACRIIIACAVLHNIAINLGEPEDEDEVEEDQPQMPAFQGPQDGRGVRDYVKQHYFS
ncbi:putative nuclease HARBI1 [Saccostrea echinata]|uniref:putative nuclease HARBI1 n=2 Tax=Saccostrea echinata TaxID=191078 RepID=UPI002A81A0E6|nr:putative nuclease HARBI1 [Saccostrea echinata]